MNFRLKIKRKMAFASDFYDSNKRLAWALAIAFMGVLLLQSYSTSTKLDVLGVAESKEYIISYDTPVKIKKIFFLPGEKVRKGQPLIEVDQSQINIKISEIQTKIDVLKSRKQLQEVIANNFFSINSRTNKNNSVKINSEKNTENNIKNNNDPLEEEISGLNKQLSQLVKSQEQGIRYALIDGVIGSINYKVNDTVAPFQTIMSFHEESPTIVQGFIHEKRHTDFKVADEVIVSSITQAYKKSIGKVISLGNRITPYPDRLQQSIGSVTWGREIVVKLMDESSFLMGEKLSISKSEPSFSLFSTNLANASFKSLFHPQVKTLFELFTFENIEASGISKYPNDDQSNLFVIASDEEGPNGSPFWLYDQKLNKNPTNLSWAINDVKTKDIEDLFFYKNFFYGISSQSDPNPDGKNLKNLITKFSLKDNSLFVARQVDFRTQLVNFLLQSELASEIGDHISKLEVESLSIFDDQAFVGIKNPLIFEGQSLILRVANFVNEMENEEPLFHFSLDSLITLKDSSCKKESKITGLNVNKTGVYILTSCSKKENKSQLWWINSGREIKSLELIQNFNDVNLEGIYFDTHHSTFYLSSDQGKDYPSKFYSFKPEKVK